MSKSEHQLRREFCKRVREAGGHAQPIEDGLTAGVPDVNVCLAGVESWMEIKTGHKLSPEQRKWLVTRARAGGRVFVLRQKGKQLQLFDGVQAALYLDRDEDQLENLAADWDSILGVLSKPSPLKN
jgi:hypothetical protein